MVRPLSWQCDQSILVPTCHVDELMVLDVDSRS
jgi:hypothetical protein